MKAGETAVTIDYHLVAKAEARANGANAHEVHATLGKYFLLCELAGRDPKWSDRLEAIERALRAFCQTGTLQPVALCCSADPGCPLV